MREYIGSRDAVAAFNGEDSGSAYPARRETPQGCGPHMAQAPVADQE